MSKATDNFWLYTAHHLVPQPPGDHKDILKHVFTFCLEPEVYLAFSALRLVVVHEAYLSRLGVVHEGDLSPGRLRERPCRYDTKLPISSGEILGPVITIVLVLSSMSHELSPLWEKYDLRDFGYDEPFPIVYDRTHPICYEARQVLRVTLEDAHVPARSVSSLTPQPFVAGHYNSREHTYGPHDIHYSLFILPTRSKRRPIPPLPSSIIRLIAQHVCDERVHPLDGARNLLSLALVCKEWYLSDLLNIVWRSPGWLNYELGSSEYDSLAQFIEKNPDRARKMVTFPQKAMYSGDSICNWMDLSDRVLQVATNLEIIKIENHEFDNSRRTLQELRRVRVFRMLWGNRRFSWNRLAFLETVLECIQSWPVLEELVLDEFQTTNATISQINQPAPYQLRRLCLIKGDIQSSHIHHLTCHPVQRLEHLVFHSLNGLKNSDLLHLFSSVAGTLLSLSIEGCTVISPTTPEEDLAFDSTVGNMHKLEYASIQGELVSSKAISERRLPKTNGQFKGTLHILDPNARVVWQGTVSAGVGLVWAVRHSGWKRIHIACNPPSSLLPELAEAVAVASSRGIDLVIQNN